MQVRGVEYVATSMKYVLAGNANPVAPSSTLARTSILV